MADITKLPTAAIPHKVNAREIYSQPEPTDDMVHGVCVYLRNLERCKGCSATEDFPPYGEGQRGCYALAAEACRVVMVTMPQAMAEKVLEGKQEKG